MIGGFFNLQLMVVILGLETLEGKSSMVPIIHHFLDNNLPFPE